ncbi:hypothetical protein BTM113_03590 [Helicobacter pylori]
MEEISQAKIELQKYYESVYVNGDGSKRGIKPFKEILRDINNFEGMSDMELLKEAQINQYYHLLKADYIMQDLAHQMDLETLKKTGIKREDFYQI